MIRNAVGAIISQGDEYLLVYKVKMIESKNGPETIPGEWDFPKGGVKSTDKSVQHALLRELREETGSTEYEVLKQFDRKLNFDFSKEIQEKIGYERQVTTMFHVHFLGDKTKLKPNDDEISHIQFVKKHQVLHQLTHKEAKDFFENCYLISSV